MSKYIDAEKMRSAIESEADNWQDTYSDCMRDNLLTILDLLQQEQPEVSIECGVRVYPTLDEKPRPWVSLYKHGISCDSIKDIPELETLGFNDCDTAIVTIKKK